jgi:hypothetical protein
MGVHNKTYLLIGIILNLVPLICSIIGMHDRYMYRTGLAIVGTVYIILAFIKPKEKKNAV